MKRTIILIPIILFIALAAWLLIAPPRWWLNLTKPIDLTDPIGTGAQLVDQYECRKCHRLGETGALKAPDLNGVAQRLDEAALRKWLEDPQVTCKKEKVTCKNCLKKMRNKGECLK